MCAVAAEGRFVAGDGRCRGRSDPNRPRSGFIANTVLDRHWTPGQCRQTVSRVTVTVPFLGKGWIPRQGPALRIGSFDMKTSIFAGTNIDTDPPSKPQLLRGLAEL